jgi:hypothetical protein
MIDPATVPADFPVQPIDPDDATAADPCTCGTCGLTWDDGRVTSMTPAPSARCPFEAFHSYEEDPPHVGHFSRLGGTWWCDTCNSPYCELA